MTTSTERRAKRILSGGAWKTNDEKNAIDYMASDEDRDNPTPTALKVLKLQNYIAASYDRRWPKKVEPEVCRDYAMSLLARLQQTNFAAA